MKLKRKPSFAGVSLCFLMLIGVHALAQRKAAPEDNTIQLLRPAISAWSKGNYVAALAEFEQIVKRDPENPKLHTDFANWVSADADRKSNNLRFEQHMALVSRYQEETRSSGGSERAQGKAQEPEAIAMKPRSAQDLANMEREEKEARDAVARMQHLYQRWAQENPKEAIYPFALSLLVPRKDVARREQYLLQAVRLAPKFTEAFVQLSQLCSGLDDVKAAEYARKASATNPDDLPLQISYARLLWASDRDASRKAYRELITRHAPKNTGAEVLKDFIETTIADDRAEAIPLIEELRRHYPEEWKSPACYRSPLHQILYEEYLSKDPARGLAFAEACVKEIEGQQIEAKPWARNEQNRLKSVWIDKASYAQALIEGCDLISAKRCSEAVTLLEKTKLPGILDSSSLIALKAEAADCAGDTRKAYEILADALVKVPDVTLQSALRRYGGKMGKDADSVENDIWSRRMVRARPFNQFELRKLGGIEKVRLETFRGKVVVIDFWYPS